ncbi:MAG: hypothetical protein JO146_09335 [Candidatus Eremiobacteraeota bacterium]|nr:hypothetical protein [Candidatus Eremiobacteraeota bacterium]
MPRIGLVLRAMSAAVAAALLHACAHTAGVMPASSSGAQGLLPTANPPACKGQKNSQDYASVTETLSTKGGALCIPEFGGFGGKVKYPGASPSVHVTLTSSTTNYNGMPQLGKGSAIFYLQLAISGATSFGNKVRGGGGLTSAQIQPGYPYTVYGQAVVFGITFNFGPCYATATSGKYGGVIGGVGTLLKGQSIPTAGNAVLEVYSGQQTSSPC